MDMILLNDGTAGYVACIRDFAELVEQHMGFDARKWLEGLLDEALEDSRYAEGLEKEIDDLKEEHRSVMKSIRKHSEKLAGLIKERELDRGAISNTAGAIGVITWREMNR